MKDRLLNYIYRKNAPQKKKLQKIQERNPNMAEELEHFLRRYDVFMTQHSITLEELADAYLMMNYQMMASRLEFLRTGEYPVATANEAFKKVYDNKQLMTQYMLGVALSQFLWEHHYANLKFYRAEIRKLSHAQHFLEVGCGHGLFLLELLDTINHFETFDVVDVSRTSLEISQNIIATLKPDCRDTISFVNADVNQFQSSNQYDFITMGEVLEHVDDPRKILLSLKSLLAPAGRVYISTCANCPAIDHVYHFKNIGEVREMLQGTGFEIENEHVAPSENKTPKQIEAMKIDVTYAAILKKETN